MYDLYMSNAQTITRKQHRALFGQTPPDLPGYICKTCGSPTPVGVGYTDYSSQAARDASEALTAECHTSGCC